MLKGVKALPTDVRFSWDLEPLATGGYHLYAVAPKVRIPQANVANPHACTAPSSQLFCIHSGALAAPPGLLHYQVAGVCADGFSEGPL